GGCHGGAVRPRGGGASDGQRVGGTLQAVAGAVAESRHRRQRRVVRDRRARQCVARRSSPGRALFLGVRIARGLAPRHPRRRRRHLVAAADLRREADAAGAVLRTGARQPRMWEHRLIWTSAAPSWWDEAWMVAREALRRHAREPERRPDTYLVLADRPDIGLKLRGKDGELEVKVRHDVRDGWELWAKIPFFAWNDLEAARFAALLRRECPSGSIDAKAAPVDGVKALLGSVDVSWREITIGKTRMQARAADLAPAFTAKGVEPSWLA